MPAEPFGYDGRGPELLKLHWASEGRVLKAADYRNPGAGNPSHVRFLAVQGVQITPEEVIGPNQRADRPRGVGFSDLGRSPWLQTFFPAHLKSCRHYQLEFYDELLDVICEAVTFSDGLYVPA